MLYTIAFARNEERGDGKTFKLLGFRICIGFTVWTQGKSGHGRRGNCLERVYRIQNSAAGMPRLGSRRSDHGVAIMPAAPPKSLYKVQPDS